jgi:hypothetical protein
VRLGRWLRRWFWTACRHPRVVRERRPIGGHSPAAAVGVLHFVCVDCGAAWPIVDRTPQEHVDALIQRRPPPTARREDP